MIRFTSLSCSAAEAVCPTDSGVWITTLFQVPFITGYAGSGSMPVTTFWKQNVPAEMCLLQENMAGQSTSTGQAEQPGLGEASPSKEGEQMASASSLVEKGKAMVGGRMVCF